MPLWVGETNNGVGEKCYEFAWKGNALRSLPHIKTDINSRWIKEQKVKYENKQKTVEGNMSKYL